MPRWRKRGVWESFPEFPFPRNEYPFPGKCVAECRELSHPHSIREYSDTMARKIVHQLIDDLDGTLIEVGEGETVLFSLDGVAYEIDLTDANAAELRAALDRYVSAARSVGSSRGSSSGGTARPRRRSGQQDYSAIRAWAKSNGFQVSERGRVPASVIEAYEAAH
jgi:hypothetical protein